MIKSVSMALTCLQDAGHSVQSCEDGYWSVGEGMLLTTPQLVLLANSMANHLPETMH